MKKFILGGIIFTLIFGISFSAAAQTITNDGTLTIDSVPTTFRIDTMLDIDSLQPANNRLPEPEDEILIELEDGDPDRPIIVGRLPNTKDTGIEHENIGIMQNDEDARVDDDDFGVVNTDEKSEQHNESDLDFVQRLNEVEAVAKKVREIVIVGSKIKDAVREAIIKGKKILENFVPAEPVVDEDGLADYAERVAAIDKNVKKIVIDESGVQVNYRQPAKLFGFIPFSLTVSASVDNEGKVKVKFPWYTFFVKHTMQDLKFNLEESVQAMNEADLVEDLANDANTAADSDDDNDGTLDNPDLSSAETNDAQLANIDLQNVLQKQQKTLQTISNVMKTFHDTAKSIIRNLR